MTGFADVFGGSTVQPADVSFRSVALSASIVTVWPAYATAGNQLARIMEVNASAGSLTITLPDATLATNGQDVLFNNVGSNTFSVLDSAGGVLATVAAGQVKYLYLNSNTTAAGSWKVILFGASSSALDASQLSGYGLKALSNTLNFAPVVTSISGNTTVAMSDRAKVFVWTGGAGTLTLPSTTASTSDFNIEVRNQGTGTLTVATTGGVTIDGSATAAFAVNESAIIHMGSTNWYTVGRGRSTQFNFTQLTKAVTGGTTTLTLTEASNVVQTYTGVLLSNQTINLPAVVQVYYVNNSTTGAYTFTMSCVGGGTSVVVPSGQASVLFCDGTNVVNANTASVGGVSTILFAAGSASTPSAAFSTTTTGFYSSGANEIGVTINATAAGKFDVTGYRATGAGAQVVQAISSAGAASLQADRPSGSVGRFAIRTASVDRWAFNGTAVAESGSNAGTNFELASYDDAGALLGNVFSVVRSTRILTFTNAPAIQLTGLLKGNNTSPVTAAAAGTDYVAPGAVTTSGLTQATSRLLGRTTASTGAVEEISVAGSLSLSAGVLTGASGGLVFLASLTPTAAANVDFLNTFSSTYDNYLILIDGVNNSTGDDALRLRFANAGAADTGSNYALSGSIGSSYTAATTAISATSTVLTAGKGASAVIFVKNANDTTNLKTVSVFSEGQVNATPGWINSWVGGVYFAANAISGFRLYWLAAANFAAQGKVRVYGISNS